MQAADQKRGGCFLSVLSWNKVNVWILKLGSNRIANHTFNNKGRKGEQFSASWFSSVRDVGLQLELADVNLLCTGWIGEVF